MSFRVASSSQTQSIIHEIEQVESLVTSDYGTSFYPLFNRVLNLQTEVNKAFCFIEGDRLPKKTFTRYSLPSHPLVIRVQHIVSLILNQNQLDFLLSRVQLFNVQRFNQVIRQASESGFANTLQFFLSRADSRFDNQLGLALQAASRAGDEEAVRILLSNKVKISAKDMGISLKYAFKNHHENILSILLAARKEISKSELGWVLVKAASNNREDLAKALLKHNQSFLVDDVSLSLEHFLSHQNKDIAQFILYCVVIPQRILESTLENACYKAHENVVSFLLQETELSSETIAKVFIKSCAMSNENIVRLLFNERSEISDEDFYLAVKACISEKKEYIFRYILSSRRQILPLDIVRIFRELLHVKLINFLNFFISDVVTADLVTRAIDEGFERNSEALLFFILSETTYILNLHEHDQQVIKFSLSYLLLDSQIGGILCAASSRGYLDTVRLILSSSREISNGLLGTSLKNSIKFNCRDIFLVLMSYIQAKGISFRSLRLMQGDYPLYFLTFGEVERDPLIFLEDISKAFPLRVILTNNPVAVDVGGITKQFISTLLAALAGKLNLSQSMLPLIPEVEDEDNDELPLQIKEVALQNKENLERIFHNIGLLISNLFFQNSSRTDKFIIGNLFSVSFFEILKLLVDISIQSPSESEDRLFSRVAKVIAKTDPKMIAAFILASLTPEEKLSFTKVFEIEEHVNREVKIRRVECRIQKEIEYFDAIFECTTPFKRLQVAKSQIKAFINPARILFESLSEEVKQFIHTSSPKKIASVIQGQKVSKEALIKSLVLRENSVELRQKLEWLHEKIQQSRHDWREAFVFSVTGNQFLIPGGIIHVFNGPEAAFEIHTCFNSIHLPSGVISKQQFFEALDIVIRDSGYNIL